MGLMNIDNIIMMGILLFLLFDILYKARMHEINEGFFDLENSQAMRGFWCLIVILVHVPYLYQNRIQDMIGSFAYIGVTFFFMTSGYGLTLSHTRNPEGINVFWRKRLPKLLVVSWMIRLVFSIINALLFGDSISVAHILAVDGWVAWLIACYLAFWLVNRFWNGKRGSNLAICILIVIGSFLVYNLKNAGIYTGTVWVTECYGFIWGIALALCKMRFLDSFKKKWLGKWGISLLVAMVLGTGYLQFKPVPFWGDYILKIALGVSITVFVLIANARISFGNVVNQFLGKISFEIYLVHGWVFILFERMMEWNSSGIYILSCIIVTIITAFCINILSTKVIAFILKALKI